MKERKLTPFGKAVKKALIDKQMSQVELANKLNVSPKYVNLILFGERSGEKYMCGIVEILELDDFFPTTQFRKVLNENVSSNEKRFNERGYKVWKKAK